MSQRRSRKTAKERDLDPQKAPPNADRAQATPEARETNAQAKPPAPEHHDTLAGTGKDQDPIH